MAQIQVVINGEPNVFDFDTVADADKTVYILNKLSDKITTFSLKANKLQGDLEMLNLPKKIENALIQNRIKTVGDLLRIDTDQLIELDGIGHTSIIHIEACLAKLNLSLRSGMLPIKVRTALKSTPTPMPILSSNTFHRL